jgi:hypothetical protein
MRLFRQKNPILDGVAFKEAKGNPEAVSSKKIALDAADSHTSTPCASEAKRGQTEANWRASNESSLWLRVIRKLEVRKGVAGDDDSYNSTITNEDLLPVPIDNRTWGKWTCTR